ncbi:alternative ribosome rescue aminoacyl-tRNA hydrolase ArfB [Polaribacter sargassicola]|uniref:alternative ribosome rescue aminoacyl-tRNA hydrolase ArfB n=1 Tax=Polaribacter sargassicola TaxID=2836891 RepID=UPI001F000E9E|nr:alternative ribosome rescue aminoacyl-tRNA hydrolase ArfB [Polaribacter sp. DS7-9]MCG1037778.1 aminoacyl-tRNA hydrolase [Polaribacter sp. DS7-9]
MNTTEIINDLQFKAVRSAGAGGQHVNKTSSKVVLVFDLEKTNALSEEEKELLKLKLASKLTKDQILILSCDTSRSQHRNKTLVIQRFLELLTQNLIRPKKRKRTQPSKATLKRNVENQKKHKEKKALRKNPKLD